MATVFTVNAQDGKPTKEETVAYLTRSFKLVEGEKFFSNNTAYSYSKYDFSINKIIETYDDGSGSTYSDFKWETLTEIRTPTCPEEYKVCEIRLYFSSYFKDELNLTWKFKEVYVLKSRAESVKKAFLRLSEIAKEENKDPFED